MDALVCDLDSLASVALFCAALKQRVKKIDLLVLNAGLFSGPSMEKTAKKSKDGLEQMFQGNHLSHFYMQEDLLPLLKAAGRARVVVVSSMAHSEPSISGGGKTANAWMQVATETGRALVLHSYGDSKLANVLHAREIQRRYSSFGITANALHPGVIKETNIWAPLTGVSRVLVDWYFFPLMWLTGKIRSIEEGADSIMKCAEEKEGGKYLFCTEYVQPSAIALDDSAARAMWECSVALCREHAPPHAATA